MPTDSGYRRIMGRVEQQGECLVWPEGRTGPGYKRISLDNRTVYVHRVVYAYHYGPIPDGLVVMHTCDNPPCVNINHLRMGTQAENIVDRDTKRKQREAART